MGIVRKYYHKKGLPDPNFFIGGVASEFTDEIILGVELNVSRYKIKNLQYDNDDFSFYIPSDFTMVGKRFDNRFDLTYFYDVDGRIDYIPIETFENAGACERLWIPAARHLDGPSGWKTMQGIGLKGFVNFPSVTGTLGNGTMNFILNNSTNVTHLKYPVLTNFALQWTNANNRQSHFNLASLERLWMPELTNISGIDTELYSDQILRNIPSSAVVYLNPILETSRKSELYVEMNGVLTGDTITLNGLTYTATTGATTGTEFNVTGGNVDAARNLKNSILADVRTGTLGSLTTRHQHLYTGILIEQTISGATGDATTFSVSDPTRFITTPSSGSTFHFGGTTDRSVYYWETIRGAEIRYITGTTTPDVITDLSGINVTPTTIDLTFTPPTGHDRPIDFYEVWIDDGVFTGQTVWQAFLPHQEISGSTATVTDLIPNTTYTFRIKAADTLYNVSDFSNTFTGTTL